MTTQALNLQQNDRSQRAQPVIPELHLATMNARREQSEALRTLAADLRSWLGQLTGGTAEHGRATASHTPARCG